MEGPSAFSKLAESADRGELAKRLDVRMRALKETLPAKLGELKGDVELYSGLTLSGGPRRERLDVLDRIRKKANAAMPALDEPQKKILASALKLPPKSSGPLLTKLGIDPGLIAFIAVVDREYNAIAQSSTRWAKIRGLVGNGSKSTVPGPPLLLTGHFMAESADPQHRPWGQLTAFVKQWEVSNDPSLSQWADKKQEISQRVKYCNPSEASLYLLEFQSGRIYKNGQPYTTDHDGTKWDIFVMDRNGYFYAGTHVPYAFHHSSFLSGGPVKGAGELRAKDGDLLAVSDRSGHYQPQWQHMRTVVKVLAETYKVPLQKVILELYIRNEKGELIPDLTGHAFERVNAQLFYTNYFGVIKGIYKKG